MSTQKCAASLSVTPPHKIPAATSACRAVAASGATTTYSETITDVPVGNLAGTVTLASDTFTFSQATPLSQKATKR